MAKAKKAAAEGESKEKRPRIPLPANAEEFYQKCMQLAEENLSWNEAAKKLGYPNVGTFKNHVIRVTNTVGEKILPDFSLRTGGSRGYIKIGRHEKTGKLRTVLSDSYLRKAGFKGGEKLDVSIGEQEIGLTVRE